jgi:hypothetical protein
MCPPIDSATPFYNAVGGYAWLTSDTIWFRIYHTEGEGNCYVHGFKFHAAVRKDVVLGRRLKLMSQASGLRIESEYSDISYLMRRVQSGIPRTQ